jgi:flavin-dependent dehydrogenase
MAAAAPALVIGGGVAGAALAAHLAQAGRPVALIERRAGPHDKVCGEFVSGEAALYLDDLGVDLTALGAVRLRAVRLCAGRHVARAALPFPAYSVSRRVLDETLLRAAAERGADIRRGRGVRTLAPREDRWIAVLDDGATVAADEVFLATGKHDLRGWRRRPGTQNDLIAFKLHWRLAPDAAAELGAGVELMLFPGGYAGLEPVEDDRTNLCLVVKRAQFAALGQRWEALLAAMRAASPLLERRLAGAVACTDRPFAIASIPYGHVEYGDVEYGYAERGRVASASRGPWRVGDQAAVIPSFAGDGIAIALHSARLAADIHLAGGSAAEFQARLARDVAAQVRRATWISRLLVRPAGQALAGFCTRMAPGIVSGVARMTRIPTAALRSSRDLASRGSMEGAACSQQALGSVIANSEQV